MPPAAAQTDPRVDAWIKDQPKELRDLCKAARGMLAAALPKAREAIKWGFPTWVGAGNIVALSAFTQHVNLQFYRGTSLPDPQGLLEGTGKELRHAKLRNAKDLRTPAVKALVRAAWRLDQEGA